MAMKRVVLGSVAVLAIAGLSLALYQQSHIPTSHVATDVAMYATAVPENATDLDYQNYHRNLIEGGSLATPLSTEAFLGRARAVLTGIVMSTTGEKQMTITVEDDAADLSHAEVYLNDQQVASATTANGGIVTRAGQSLATMHILVPANPPSFVYVDWTSASGSVRSQVLYNP